MTRPPPEIPANSSDGPLERPVPAPLQVRPGRVSRPPRRRLRDVWSDDRARWFKGFAWGAYPGTIIGGVAFFSVGPIAGITLFLLFTLGTGGFAMGVPEGAGSVVRGVTNPKGRPSPGKHSVVDAMVMRGEPEKAITTLRISLETYPDDAEAYLRIARILRDELTEPRSALEAFREGRAAGCFTVRHMRVSMREMVELARKIGEAGEIAPDLEAHRELFGESDEAAWAARELAELSLPGGASAS